jgi:hydrogenase expression/formation protein HypE
VTDAPGTSGGPEFDPGQRVLRDTRITLSHGSGGKAMQDLIEDVFLGSFNNPVLATLEDQARLDLAELAAQGDRLAFTTDSYVVDPLFFPGADIGALAVNGTVNDLAMSGARPLYLSCAMILEEGLGVDTLRRVTRSMAEAAVTAGVAVVTGDTKVVHRGAADKLFVNTAGIGVIPRGVEIGAHRVRPGDVILVNGPVGDHGAAIVGARGELALDAPVESDCRPLHGLVAAMLAACPEVHCLRDATRGGVATILNEIAQSAGFCLRIREVEVPVREAVRGLCEILGFDPLYLANEGTLVALVPSAAAEAVLAAMRGHPAGGQSVMIGRVDESPAGLVLMKTRFGSERILDRLVGEQLPRIC